MVLDVSTTKRLTGILGSGSVPDRQWLSDIKKNLRADREPKLDKYVSMCQEQKENTGVDDGHDSVVGLDVAKTKLPSGLEKRGERKKSLMALKGQIEKMAMVHRFEIIKLRTEFEAKEKRLKKTAEAASRDLEDLKKINKTMASIIEEQKVTIETKTCLLEKMQQEHDAARTEAEVLRQENNDQKISLALAAGTIEYSYAELRGATKEFNEGLKIGEGIYKGFLHNTSVTIKMLDRERCMHVKPESFIQEVKMQSSSRDHCSHQFNLHTCAPAAQPQPTTSPANGATASTVVEAPRRQVVATISVSLQPKLLTTTAGLRRRPNRGGSLTTQEIGESSRVQSANNKAKTN